MSTRLSNDLQSTVAVYKIVSVCVLAIAGHISQSFSSPFFSQHYVDRYMTIGGLTTLLLLPLDMAIQNVIGDSFRGATWVAIHNGGGVGW